MDVEVGVRGAVVLVEVTVGQTARDQQWLIVEHPFGRAVVEQGTRARRQQQVMLAVRDRVLDFNLLPNLITQLPSMWKSLAGSYKTDLSPEDAAALALQLKDINEDAIRMGVVDETATLEYTTPEGASVLVPDTAKVNELIREVLYPPPDAN